MFYAERDLTGHGDGFQSAESSAGDKGLFLVPREVDHGYDTTGSASGFRGLSATMAEPPPLASLHCGKISTFTGCPSGSSYWLARGFKFTLARQETNKPFLELVF